MTIKEKTIIEDKLNCYEEDINIIIKSIKDNNVTIDKLEEFDLLWAKRQLLIDFIFECGYWFKRLHEDGWEIDIDSFE